MQQTKLYFLFPTNDKSSSYLTNKNIDFNYYIFIFVEFGIY